MSLKPTVITSVVLSVITSAIPVTGPTLAQGWLDQEKKLIELHQLCDRGHRRACIQFGIIIGEIREAEARNEARRRHPEWYLGE